MKQGGPGIFAFTLASNNGLLRDLRTNCRICPGFDPKSSPNPPPALREYGAIWDTGATSSVITQRVVDDCSLAPIGRVKVHGVLGEETSPVYLVNMMLPNNVGIPNIKVTLGKITIGIDVLIGMDIITKGDFSITNKNSKTIFTFRIPSQHHVDFVKEINSPPKQTHGPGRRKKGRRR